MSRLQEIGDIISKAMIEHDDARNRLLKNGVAYSEAYTHHTRMSDYYRGQANLLIELKREGLINE